MLFSWTLNMLFGFQGARVHKWSLTFFGGNCQHVYGFQGAHVHKWHNISLANFHDVCFFGGTVNMIMAFKEHTSTMTQLFIGRST